MPRLLLLLLATIALGCGPQGDPARRDSHAIAAHPAACDRWRLVVGSPSEIASFEHPFAAPTGAGWSLGVRGLAAADETLFVASDEGIAVGALDGELALLLDHPTRALAHDPRRDRLYAALAGDLLIAIHDPVAPAPYATLVATGSPDALAVGIAGHLFAADDGVVTRFEPDGHEPVSFTSPAWRRVRDMAIGVDGSLYLVDGTDTVFVVDNPELAAGEVTPTKRVAVAGATELTALLIAPDGIAYLADRAGVHTIPEISDAYPAAEPTLSLSIETPTALALLPPCAP